MKKNIDQTFKKERTFVTSVFSNKGYAIEKTDYDDVVLKKGSINLNVNFDCNSNAKAFYIIHNGLKIRIK